MTQETINHLTFLNAEIRILECEENLLENLKDVMITVSKWEDFHLLCGQVRDLGRQLIPLWSEQSSLEQQLDIECKNIKRDKLQMYIKYIYNYNFM